MSRLKLNIREALALAFLIWLYAFNVSALDLEFTSHTPNGCQLADKAIVLSGSIVQGDNEKLSNWIRQNTWYLIQTNPPFVVDLQGGNLSEALKIADTFDQVYASVWLPGGCENAAKNAFPKCSGSCFALVMGAVNRLLSSDTIGLYTPEFNPAEFSDHDPDTAQQMYLNTVTSYMNWLKTRQVPATLIEKIKTHTADNIFWLDEADAASIADTSPEFEQIMSEKCHYQKGLLSQWIDANSSGKSDEAKLLREQWDKQSKCMESIRIDARERWALP